MHIRSIRLRRFMNLQRADLRLPAEGIVVVTGANGSGKSALVLDALQYALTGRSARGSRAEPPDLGEDEMVVEVHAETRDDGQWRLVRSRHKDKPHLDFAVPGDEDGTAWLTARNAQKSLDLALEGGPTAWLARGVYAAEDAGGFCGGSAMARAKFIEAVCRLPEFKMAHARAKAFLAEVENDARSVDAARTRFLGQADAIEEHAERIHEELKGKQPLPEPKPWDVEHEREAQQEYHRLNDAANAVLGDNQARHAMVAADRVKSTAKKLGQGYCPTCSRDVPDDMLKELQEEAAAAQEEAQALHDEWQGRVEQAQQAVREAGDRVAQLAQERREHAGKVYEAQTYNQKLQDAGKQARDAEARLEKARAELEGLNETHDKLKVRAASRRVAADVLHIRGVRMQILASALAGLETATNMYLEQLCSDDNPMAVEIHPERTLANGEKRDEIEVIVHGAGGAQGYLGCSRGQRRRLDVAVALAQADMVGLDGTLVFDEVFDNLDDDGVTRVAAVLEKMADNRAVIIITHNQTLLQRLSPALHVHVDDGQVSLMKTGA